MSRIFRISGNFMQSGKWSKPNPSFSGKIIADEEGRFYGYCEELYDGASDASRIQYIAGAFAENNHRRRQGIAFFKMSNDPSQDPLAYITLDLENPESGSWSELSTLGRFLRRGRTRIVVEEEAFSKKAENSIRAKYDTLDKSINGNDKLLKEIQSLVSAVVHSAA